jgi:DNA-binding MarR family transcriptional regulator
MFIFSNNIQGATEYTPTNVHATIRRLVDQGIILQQRIDDSFKRIMALKKSR